METGMNIPARENSSELKDQCVRAAKKTTVRRKQTGALAWRTLWARMDLILRAMESHGRSKEESSGTV